MNLWNKNKKIKNNKSKQKCPHNMEDIKDQWWIILLIARLSWVRKVMIGLNIQVWNVGHVCGEYGSANYEVIGA